MLVSTITSPLQVHSLPTQAPVIKVVKPKEPLNPQLTEITEITTKANIPVQPSKQPNIVAATGNKYDWMRAAGIPESEWQYVDYIVTKEAGWDPCAYNPSKSDCSANPTSACGLAQSLPCGKQSKFGHWTDPVANLKWQYEYVTGRYGGYAQAYDFWKKNRWY